VIRTWVFADGQKERMTHRLVSYLSFNALATVAGLLERRHFDVILAPNASFFTGASAFVCGAARRIPFVYNVQDLYPATFVAAGQLRNRPAIAALERIERTMYRLAAHVSVITPCFRDHLVGLGVPEGKVSVIPNFVDTDFIRPLPRDNAFGRRHGLEGRFVVTHAGNMGYVYDLDTMLEAAALLADLPEVLFLIVGDGVAKPALQRRAENLGLDNVRFLPFQPLEDLPELRAASDVHVSLYRWGSARYSMPSKVYEIMSCERPLLASADPGSDVWQLAEGEGFGVCVEPQNPRALADAVRALARDPEMRAQMGRRGRAAAERAYSRQAVGRQYAALLENLVANTRRP
jgi:colanic acid biosynthesis glycosyl transferase WcaI